MISALPLGLRSSTAIEMAKCGIEWRKLVVPSIGSTIQRGFVGLPSIAPPSSSYKPAMLDNGVRVMVPPHISAGTKIVVDVYEQTYVRRAD